MGWVMIEQSRKEKGAATDMSDDEVEKLSILEVDKLMSKPLTKIILDTEFAKKLWAGKCKTLAEANYALLELADLSYHINRLKVYALENKALIAGQIAERWLPNELYHRIDAEWKERHDEHLLALELDTIQEAVSRVRKLLFVETKDASFKSVICTHASVRNQDLRTASRFEATFAWQDPSGDPRFPNLSQQEVRISVPFGKTAGVYNGGVKGGIDIELVVGTGAWDTTRVLEDIYDLEMLQDVLAKTLGVGDVAKLNEWRPRKEVREWYGLDDMLEDFGYGGHDYNNWRNVKRQIQSIISCSDSELDSDGTNYWYSPSSQSLNFRQ